MNQPTQPPQPPAPPPYGMYWVQDPSGNWHLTPIMQVEKSNTLPIHIAVHLIHLVLTVVTCGLWLIVWVLHIIIHIIIIAVDKDSKPRPPLPPRRPTV